MKMPKFSANLGFLFLEGSSIINQFQLAAKCGFRFVEFPFPSNVDRDELVKVQKLLNLEVALINIEVDPEAKFGCASFPGSFHRENFKKHLLSTIELSKLLNCKKIHLMSGKLEGPPSQENYEIFIENLKYAAKVLENEDIVGVIEPINNYSVPNYFLHDYKYAIEAIKTVKSDKIKLMLDIFHCQMIQGNLMNSFKEYKAFIGHVQVAQTPNRNEPNSEGELNLKYLLDNIEYDGVIGMEYRPSSSTLDSLSWIKDFGYKL